MRITRLSLAAYGHFTELALDFPTPAGLHVVLGANEAGKSTALAAIEDALFGFPHRSDAAWRHSPRDLRVGLTLQRDDGGERTFWRRKGREPTLHDDAGQPVGEAALAGFLGNLGRERFRRVFGLNDSGLRQGGQAILAGSGDLGESVLEAETGLAGARAALQTLDRAANALFGDRRGSREIWASLSRYEAARKDLTERSVRGPDHDRAASALASLEASADSARRESAALVAERTRLSRIRATAPIRAALRGLLAERAALGDVKRLADDADLQRQQAVLARAQARRDLEGRLADRRRIADTLGSLCVDETVLADAAAIELVARDLSRIEAETTGIAALVASSAGHRADAIKAARALGLDLPLERIAVPEAPLRRRARALLASEPALREAVRQAEAALSARRTLLSGLAMPEGEAPDAAAFASVVESVRALGPLDTELTEARLAGLAAQATLADALAALPLWHGTADEVVRLALPLERDEAASAERLARAAEDAEAALRSLSEHERAATDAADDLRATSAHGAPPSRETVAARRKARDVALDELLEADPGSRGPVVARYRLLVREADAAAARRADEAARIEEIARLKMAVDRTALALDGSRRQHVAADGRYHEAEAVWRALWRSSIVHPGSPDAMREWRRQHAEIVALHGRAAGSRQEIEAQCDRIEACHARLDEWLPPERIGLAVRLDRAEMKLRQVRRTLEARTSQAVAHAAARREGEREQTLLDAALAGRAAWQADWSSVASLLRLSLPSDVAVAAGTLDHWEAFEVARAAFEADERALAVARDAARDYDATLDQLKALVPGAASIGGGRALPVSVLRAALRAAEDARRERDRLGAELAATDRSIANLERDCREAGDRLAGLMAMADVPDEAALERVIERAVERARLDALIASRGRELACVDDGRGLDALDEEAACLTLPADELPARLDTIDDRLSVLETQARVRADERAALQAELREMGERTSSDAAVAMQDELVSMAEDGGRYIRLRLAHALLGAGIERLRRENQDPLLAHAGGLFRTLTRDRYQGLVADDEDGRTVMLARRHDGSTCPVGRLSEGTLDQLYLALRLASLERHGAGAERIPLIADDLLASFDDERARAALEVLRAFGAGNQTILFTHHGHIAAMAADAGASLHQLEVG